MKSKASQINYKKVEDSGVQNWMKWLPYLLVLITFFVYANSLKNGYNLDDELVTRNHPLTSKGISGISEIFTSPYYKDDSGYSFGYRPVVLTSFAIEFELFGENPQVGHFINLLIYLTTIFLGFKLAINWFGQDKKWIAFMALLIFAVHPLHTEVVNSLKNRDELLSLFFSFLLLVQFNSDEQTFSIKKLIFVVLLGALAVLSKKSALPLLMLIPVYLKLVKMYSNKLILFYALPSIAVISISGSDFQWLLMLKIAFVSFVSLLSVFFLERIIALPKLEYNLFGRKFEFHILYPLLSLLIFLLLLLVSKNYFFVIPIVIVSSLLLVNRTIFIEVLTVFTFYSVGFILKSNLTIEFTLALSIIFIAEKFLLIRRNYLYSLYLLMIVPYFFYSGNNAEIIQLIAFIIVIAIYLVIKMYRILLILIFILYVIGVIVSFDINLFGLLLITSLTCTHFAEYKKLKLRMFSLLSILFISVFIIKNDSASNLITVSKTSLENKLNDVISEGRVLNYVENPLVKSISLQDKVNVGLKVMDFYSEKLIFPYPLKFYYGYNETYLGPSNDFHTVFGFLILVSLIFFATFLLLKLKGVEFFLVIVLLSNFLFFSNWVELVAGIVGERFIYIATFSFSLLVILLINRLISSQQKYITSIVSLVFVIYALITVNRNSAWKSSLNLMQTDIKELHNSAQANNLYAFSLMRDSYENNSLSEEERNKERAIAVIHLSRAVEIYPEFSNAWYDLGRAAWSINDTAKAIKGFSKSIELNPNFYSSYYELLTILEIQNNKKAHLQFSKKLFLVNKEPRAYFIYAKSLMVNDFLSKAKQIIANALEKFPNDKELINFHNELQKIE